MKKITSLALVLVLLLTSGGLPQAFAEEADITVKADLLELIGDSVSFTLKAGDRSLNMIIRGQSVMMLFIADK